ncbi:hypothetical protein BS47DRAFT_880012 [Hydnum rufescens UP504]|uniref:Uncharacterized protein n=1 Tax=Hydnum rufescens UP504 TaxID=1448309 RepID=A0A9P6AYJ1_9AGAM|nr:hypothetical protein BS47DRAFT_880012 [Hydnum rufescens UP504]
MDIDDPADGVPHEADAVDDSYMSIAATEFNPSPTRHSQADGMDMTGDISDMSIAATAYPGSGRESLATNAGEADAFTGPSSPQVVSYDEPPASHEFVVPVGRHIPRTDSDGNVLSPTPAEKAKAAALESLGKFSRDSGGNADPENGDDDDEEGPVVPIRIGNDMSIEDASRRIRAASEGLDFDDGGDQTMSTVSSDSTGDITGKHLAEATINFTAMRKSLPPTLPPTIDIAEAPAPSLPESVPFPSIPPSKASKGPSPPPLAVFTPATPTRSTSVPPRSPAKPPSFTAAFAPSVVTPRKRALSAPSPSPSPAKKRAASPSSSKPAKAVPINIFQTSPTKLPPLVVSPSKSSFLRPTSPAPAKVSKPAATPAMPEVRNPFVEPATSQPAPQANNARPLSM